MNSARLKSYGCDLKKIAEANARDDQFQIIRNSQFKASLVDDPLQPNPDLVRTIEASRKNARK